MSVVEIRGGRITHRYLMNKSRHDIARLFMEHITASERIVSNLLEHAVYDRERNDECAAAVEAAESFIGVRD